MPRFIACADLHLGKQLLTVPPAERLAEQEQVWQQIVDLATVREADAILFAGDAFEGPIPTPEHYEAFMRPLQGWDVPLIMIRGNGRHDAAARATSAPEALAAGEQPYLRVSTAPETIPLPCGLTVCTLPWTPISRLVAQAGGGDRDRINERAAELLIEIARGLREQVEGPAVLMAHWSVSGASLPNGLPVDQLREPVLDVEALARQGWGAVVLGHIHVAGRVHDEEPIFYCGSPLPLDFGEAGTAHGCYVLDTAERSLEFVPLRSTPLLNLEVDAGGEWRHMVSLGSSVKLRVRKAADEQVDVPGLRETALDAGASSVFVQVDVERQARARIAVSEDLGPLDALEAWMGAQEINGTVVAAALDRAGQYLEAVKQ